MEHTPLTVEPVTYLRLISELEGVSQFLPQMPDSKEELEAINAMKKKYYKLYFKSIKEQ